MRLLKTNQRVSTRTAILLGAYVALGLLVSRLEPANAIAVSLVIGAGSLVLLASRWRDQVVTEIRRNRAAIQEAAAMSALSPDPGEPSLPWGDAALSPKALLRLVGIVQIRRARTVVECGSGVSTLVLARQFKLSGGGHVYALEHDRGWYELMQGWLVQRKLTDYATLIHAPLERVELDGRVFLWYSLSAAKPVLELARVELLLVDGPPGNVGSLARYPALPLLRARLAPASLVVLDDAQRPDERRIGELWSEQLALEAERVDGLGAQLEWRLGPER